MNHISGADQEIEGVLERIVYCNQENGWSVVKISLEGGDQIATAVGNLLGVQPGEYIRLKGMWVNNKEYGRQFQADTYTTVKPATLQGIERYLSSGMIKGIGKEMARRLVKAFGMDVLDIIENHKRRLTEVPGIGKVRAKRIVEAWERQKEIKDVMIFLQSHGVSSTYAIKIYKTYGREAMSIIRQDPYRLAIDIYGIGFRTADKVASSIGISPLSPKRIQAGLLYVLGGLTDKGHVYYPYHELCDETAGILDVDKVKVYQAIEDLSKETLLVIEKIGQDKAVYLKPLYLSEIGVAKGLKELSQTRQKAIRIDIEKAVSWFEARHAITLAPEQRDAISSAIKEKILVITGGPGTGKTTLIRAIIEILEKKGRRINLCAPTGRAAKRMSEATGRHAKTIHRLLEFNPRSMKFDRNSKRPLNTDMLIVDEASMVDIVMFYNVLKALPFTAQVIMVGDVDQLPSVGPGNVLGDIITCNMMKVVYLKKIFRQARKSLIIINAHRINQGQAPYTKAEYGKGDFFFIDRDEPEDVAETIKELVVKKIPKGFGFNPIHDIQVISPMHKGVIGVANLNKELQGLLNPSAKSRGGEGITKGGQVFCIGDKVMQIRNNYELGVFNGDIGQIISIDDNNKEVLVRFDYRVVRFEYSDMDELTLAYACSIHKSQGSEYPAVVIALHTQHYIMLQRNLLYTAVTRGKSLVVVVGNFKAMSMAINNIKKGTRHTFLKERLITALPVHGSEPGFYGL